MAIDGVSGRTSYLGSGILNLRTQLETLTRQLSTGRISNTYAGDGTGRSLAIGLRAQISDVASYSDTMVNIKTRLNVANLSLQRLADISNEVKGAAVSAGNALDNNGQTPGQRTANLDFYDSVDMLNAQSGDRFLFGGRATDAPPVTAADQILNGNGAGIAGLKQVIAERAQADLGTGGTGRISNAIGVPATSVVLTEQDATPALPGAPVPFGMKLTAISTTIAGATVTQPAAPPITRSMAIDLNASIPNAGDQVKLTLQMPDGTSEDITLTASSATPLPANSFAIGTTSAQTASNLNDALTAAVKALANGPMVAASAIQAGNEFFGQPPMRVVGPAPLDTATALTAGTRSDTVFWYNGEQDIAGDPARGTAVGRIDDGVTVQYGIRADEQALRQQLQTVAVFAAFTTSASDTYGNGKVVALNQRVAQNLASAPGTQTIQNIQADLAGAQAAIKATGDRQVQTKALAQTMLDSIEGINNDEVATKILALQTSLQASYQTTAQLYQLSLVKFL